jgi:hypothetical protein
MPNSIIINHRFQGPPNSGNGGYVCGRLARYIDGPATVRLKSPPRLETELSVRHSGQSLELRDGDQVVAHAWHTDLALEPPSPPSFSEAEDASKAYRGHQFHPFPGCFVCGPDRPLEDGLRLFPGPIPKRSIVASPWMPDASLANTGGKVQTEFLWAALDCPGAFTFKWPQGGAVLLGELTASIDGALQIGERCVVIGWEQSQEGRKHYTGTAIFDSNGICRAKARATWIEVRGIT